MKLPWGSHRVPLRSLDPTISKSLSWPRPHVARAILIAHSPNSVWRHFQIILRNPTAPGIEKLRISAITQRSAEKMRFRICPPFLEKGGLCEVQLCLKRSPESSPEALRSAGTNGKREKWTFSRISWMIRVVRQMHEN